MNSESFSLLFERAQSGDWRAQNAVYRLAHVRLRAIAAALLRRERPGHTLQPTALVNELFLKLHKLEARILGEDHFFGVSARAMKQVLVDHARIKAAKKRIEPETVTGLLAGAQSAEPEMLLGVKLIFERLQRVDPVAASTVWLRCVEGRSIEEVSHFQSRGAWRVRADYDFGVKWMADRLTSVARSSKSATAEAQSPASVGRCLGSES